MKVLGNPIMDTEIPVQLQKVKIGRKSRPLTTKKDFINSLAKDDASKDSRHTAV